MEREAAESFIQTTAREHQQDLASKTILWSRHALAELIHEGWELGQVERAFQQAEIVEQYPALHPPLPDCLILGRFASGQPFHAVPAIDEGRKRLLIVTVYKPWAEEWENDWRTRRK